MFGRRKGNDISSILVEGTPMEGVDNVCHVVFSHFSHHFKAHSNARHGMDDLHLRTLSYREGYELIKPFCIEEVKAEVSDCDSYISHLAGGINFGFIKQFWDVLKEDFMRFLLEFHRAARLAKAIDCFFIGLIPKVVSPQ